MSEKTEPKLTPEADRRLREAQSYVKGNLNNINQKMIEKDLWTPDNLYLEFSLCKDYTLGCVYYLLKHDPRFNKHPGVILKKINEKMSVWQDRVWDDFEWVYPNLPIKNKHIEALLADTSKHDEIFRISPNTVYYILLRDDLLANINHTHVRGDFTRIYIDESQEGRHFRTYKPISMTVNTYPIQLTKARQDMVGKYLAELYSVDVTIISRDPSMYGPSDIWLKEIEQFYINKIGAWTKSDFIKKKIYESIGNVEQYLEKMPFTDPRLAKIIETNPAWFAKSKFLARALFDKEYRTTLVKDDPTFAMDAVLNHLCLFIDITWSPTVATRFTPPPPPESHVEERAEQLTEALQKFS